MSTEGSPAPGRALCSRCSVTPPPGSADFRREPRFSFVFRVCRAMRVPCRKQRSSKTACPSRGPRFLPCPHSVRPSVCCGKIKRKHKTMMMTTTRTTGANWVGTGVGAGSGCVMAPDLEQGSRNLPGNQPASMQQPHPAPPPPPGPTPSTHHWLQ